jgi:hypothetical protein
VRLGTWLPFARAAEQLAYFWRVSLSEATARRATEAAGAAYVATQEAAVAALAGDTAAPPRGPAVQLLSADGAMVPLVGKGQWAEAKTLTIGTVRPPEWHPEEGWRVRTADHSYFARLADHRTFTEQAVVETTRRGVATAGTVVGVTDGSVWLQGFLDYHRPDAVRVLDFPHAVGHLAAAGQATFGAESAPGAVWLAAQARQLKDGDPMEVLLALLDLPARQAPDPAAARAARDATLGYLAGRWAHIQYARFQAAGYPIGSGAMESANKLVVEARLKGAGMHWARHHVDGMLALRTVACADRWAEAWPQIAARCRATARHPRPAAPVRAAASTPPPPVAAPPARRSTAIPQLPPERPPGRHPWRYPLLPGGRARQPPLTAPPDAKL